MQHGCLAISQVSRKYSDDSKNNALLFKNQALVHPKLTEPIANSSLQVSRNGFIDFHETLTLGPVALLDMGKRAEGGKD